MLFDTYLSTLHLLPIHYSLPTHAVDLLVVRDVVAPILHVVEEILLGRGREREAKKLLELARRNGERSTRDECRHNRLRQELDQHAKAEHPHQKLDQPGKEVQEDRVLVDRGAIDAAGALGDQQRDDCSRPNGEITASAEDSVDEQAHEGRVEAELRRKMGYATGVCDRLRHKHHADRDPGDGVVGEVWEMVSV